VANAFISPFQHTTALLCFPKNLIPLRDSNPGLLVPEVDVMSTAPRYQGNIFTSYANKLPCVCRSGFGSSGTKFCLKNRALNSTSVDEGVTNPGANPTISIYVQRQRFK
jgi:hypothetical protein